MSTIFSPILGCGSMHFSAADNVLIFSVIGGWLISAVLALVNLCLITVIGMNLRSMMAHFGFLFLYVISGFTLFDGWFGDATSWHILVPVCGIPILVISHFVQLLRTRRKLRLAHVDAVENITSRDEITRR